MNSLIAICSIIIICRSSTIVQGGINERMNREVAKVSQQIIEYNGDTPMHSELFDKDMGPPLELHPTPRPSPN